MTTYGFVRVSTAKQKFARQIENIKQSYPDALILTEAFTGASMNRPVWNKLMKMIKPGDCIVFDEVSRMSRNADEGFKIYQELFSKGVDLIFLKEPHINTAVYKDSLSRQIQATVATGNTATDKFMESILSSLNTFLFDLARQQIEIAFQKAEDEVKYLRRRTSEGVRRAQIEGKIVGRQPNSKIQTKKSINSKQQILKYAKDFNGHLTDKECLRLIGISPNTYYKYKKELKTKE